MQKLIAFFVRNAYLLVFLMLEVFSLWLVSSFNEYPRSVMLSSGNAVVGGIYQKAAAVGNYFGLKNRNDSLAAENARLMRTVMLLESTLEKQRLTRRDTLRDSILADRNFRFIPAKVINNSTNRVHNFITLNKGERDGVKVDMGVLSGDGIAGIVCTTSERFSIAISVLNPQIKVSCQVRKSGHVGSLVWTGDDARTARLEDISAHLEIADGDTIVTSGYSSVFPPDIPVGVIARHRRNEADSYHDIDVRLFTGFGNLSYVKIVDFLHKEELAAVEESVLQ